MGDLLVNAQEAEGKRRFIHELLFQNVSILGGVGDDILIYQGASSEYEVTKNPDGTFTIDSGASGKDTVNQVEFVQFSDGTFNINDLVMS